MTDFYVLWGTPSQSLTQVVEKLFEDQKIIHIDGDNFPSENLGDLTDVEAVVWTAKGDVRKTLEALPELLEQQGLSLARIIGVLDVVAYAGDRKLGDWVKMLSHFSDVMLVEMVKITPAAFVSDLERRWKDRPMLIKRWPQQAKDVTEILQPEARRLSEYFDNWDDDDDVEFFEGDVNDESDEPWAYEDKKAKSHSVREVKIEDINEPKAAEAYFAKDAEGSYKMKVYIA